MTHLSFFPDIYHYWLLCFSADFSFSSVF